MCNAPLTPNPLAMATGPVDASSPNGTATAPTVANVAAAQQLGINATTAARNKVLYGQVLNKIRTARDGSGQGAGGGGRNKGGPLLGANVLDNEFGRKTVLGA